MTIFRNAFAGALIAASPAAADVTLINLFEVPPVREAETLEAWGAARTFLSGEPGYIDTTLHRALDREARYTFINVAHWESAEDFTRAIRRMHAAGVFPQIEGVVINPALYRAMGRDAAE